MNAIARKDWLEFVRDRRMVIAAVLMVVLSMTALLLAARQVEAHQRNVAAAMEGDRRTWLSQGAQDPHGAAHFATWAFRPLTATALLDPAAEPYAPVAIWMEAHSRNLGTGRAVEDRAVGIDLGEFSLAWTLQTLAPLLILVLAAGMVARERERGSLRLLLASNASAAGIVSAKALALGQILALIMVPLAVSAIGTVILAPLPFDGDQAVRLAGWIVVQAAYLTIFALIGIAVSVLAGRTDRALLIVVGIWLLTVALGPRLGGGIADALAPTPQAMSFWSQIEDDHEQGLAGDPDAETRDKILRQATLARYGVKTVEELPVNWDGVWLDALERYSDRIFDLRYSELYAQRDRQHAAMRWTGLISPLIAAQNLSAGLAGTDEAHQRRFAAAAEAYRRPFVAKLNADLATNGAGKAPGEYRADPSLWRALEPFTYRAPPIASMAGRLWVDAAVLTAWLLAALGLLLIATRRLARQGPDG